MKPTISPQDLCAGVFAVPPLARRTDASRTLDFEQNNLIVRHILSGGITRLLYGGNAFLYHLTLREYEQLLDWLTDLAGSAWAIPSIGEGLERGYREIAAAANKHLIVYLKEENNLGTDREAGLDAVARLVNDGVCIGIKYAVVRQPPCEDVYLEALLNRVDRKLVISGIGERPAVVHLRDWKLTGLTTGSGCIAPRLTQLIFEACRAGDFDRAENLRAEFIPLEDLRDLWGPAKVLHAATQLADIARMGDIPPYVSALSSKQEKELTPVVKRLIASS